MAEKLLVTFYLFFGHILNDRNLFLQNIDQNMKIRKEKKAKKIMCASMIKLKVT
jgi:hypothetical protein